MAEEAVLADAKPETEAEAIAALDAAGKGEAQLWKEMFDKPKKGEVRQCHSCSHRPETVCQMCKQVMKPNSSCSNWSS